MHLTKPLRFDRIAERRLKRASIGEYPPKVITDMITQIEAIERGLAVTTETGSG
tara:strand:- start:70 stop:231 length:162 start_codon:yes stop_codon:yes gene_type:complete